MPERLVRRRALADVCRSFAQGNVNLQLSIRRLGAIPISRIMLATKTEAFPYTKLYTPGVLPGAPGNYRAVAYGRAVRASVWAFAFWGYT